MVLEWLRRNDVKVDEYLREYLFTEGSIVAREAEVEGKDTAGAGGSDARNATSGDGSLGIGCLKSEGGQ
jgi:hypothetical protein